MKNKENNTFQNTYTRLYDEIKLPDQKKDAIKDVLYHAAPRKTTKMVRNIALAAASLLLITLCGFQYSMVSEAAYITYSSDAQVGLSINRKDQVIKAYALNEEGEALLEEVDVLKCNYNEAFTKMVDYENRKHCRNTNPDVSVECKSQEKSEEIEASICENYEKCFGRRNQMNQNSVSDDSSVETQEQSMNQEQGQGQGQGQHNGQNQGSGNGQHHGQNQSSGSGQGGGQHGKHHNN